MFNKKSAFTLTEILIALTIIGVVAALTVPMVLTDTAAKANRVKVQKAFTAISEAMQIADTKLDYNAADLTSYTEGGDSNSRPLEGIFLKTMNAVKTDLASYPFSGRQIVRKGDGCSGSLEEYGYSPTGISSAVAFKTSDGVYYVFNTNETLGCTKTQLCVGYIDINGPKGPNELIDCTSGTNVLFYYDTTNKKAVTPAECTVDKNAITDVYPFVFYNATVKPANSAFETVLNINND